MVIVIVIGVLLVGVVIALVAARRGAGRVGARVDAVLADLDVRRQAKASLDGAGRGLLVLTPEELVFVQFVPEDEVRIPLAAITEVAGESDGRPRLAVTWAEGASAWDVPDVDGWRAALATPGAAS